MQSSTSKLAITLIISIAVHGLLLISGEQPEPYLSERSIIHARLDIQDRELVQHAQTGQISQQHNNDISQASESTEAVEEQVLKQETTQTKEKSKIPEIISSQSPSKVKKQTEIIEDTLEPSTDTTEIKELVEKIKVNETKAKIKQDSQVNNDSRAQVEALEGSEDPTYTSYRRVLKQYLRQRLEASAEYQGTVRLKIKLEYGSFATSVKIIQSSGNLEIDDWAKKAALAANPYPKIPKEIGSTFEFSPTLELGKLTP